MISIKKWATGLGLLCAMAVSSVSMASFDQQIVIEKALNNPSFSVKYSGAAAAVVELRINGVSIGTRTVSPARTSGEVEFNIDLTSLIDGDNKVEVRLFDKNGKLVGVEKIVLQSYEEGNLSPIRLAAPKMGSSVQGTVDIQVGFGKELDNVYVSFFVDDKHKALTNVAPYSYLWDTTLEPNGWHELQAWVVDGRNNTFKTRKIRVFVNNPGGRTERQVPAAIPATKTNVALPKVSAPKVTAPKVATPKVATPKNVAKVAVPAKVVSTASATTKAVATAAPTKPAYIPLSEAKSITSAVTTAASGFKAPKRAEPYTASAKLVVPKLSPEKAPLETKLTVTSPNEVRTGARRSIRKGDRLDVDTFAIVFNGTPLKTDVAPMTLEGIPLAPVRHLIEHEGGKVEWEHFKKTVTAQANGKKIMVRIGDEFASINDIRVEMEYKAFIKSGRTMIPITFLSDVMEVQVDYDAASGHMLITSLKKK